VACPRGDFVEDLVGGFGAIHLATALLLRQDIAGLVTYDARLAGAAAGAGIGVLAPA
jgi:hypothetical protein